MGDKVFQWLDNNGGLNAMTLDQISKMPPSQFATYDGRMVNVKKNRRYDTLVIPANAVTETAKKTSLFRKGLGEKDTYHGTNTEFTKTLVHTNMLGKGEFDQGENVAIERIEIECPLFGGKPTAQAAGVVTNAKATFPANFDPAMTLYRLLNQLWVRFKMSNATICEGKALYFASIPLLYAAFGANAGAMVTNGVGINLLSKVITIEGSRDFMVEVENLASWDSSTANGLDMEIPVTAVLVTTELSEAVPQ